MFVRLQKKRETNDYNDFYIASYGEATEQMEAASNILEEIKVYLQEKGNVE